MKSFKDWISEGETIYNQALTEYQDLEKQLAELEAHLAEKKEEVNQIAAVIGRPPIAVGKADGTRVERMGQVQLVDRGDGGGNIPASRQTIAKVLAGKSI